MKQRGALIDESHNLPLEYEPFTMFRERPQQGRWVNVHSAGFRLGKKPLPWPIQRKNADDFIIFIFGGSTTFGYGIPDSETIPSQLQHHLSFGTKRAVKIYNFGRASYYSTQESILLERLICEGNIPDLVIFIDGLNDFYYYQDVPEFTKSFMNVMKPQRTKEAWSRILSKLPIIRLSKRLAENRNPAETDFPASAPPYNDPATLDAVITRYTATQKNIRAVAAAYDIKTLFVLQPVPHYRYDQKLHPFSVAGYGNHSYSMYGYSRMLSSIAQKQHMSDFLDLSGIQENLNEPLYVDLVHYNARFCDIIAGYIAEKIIQLHMGLRGM
jgi:lysophospholipase L1-like esterase